MDFQTPVVEHYAVDPGSLLTTVGGSIAAAREGGLRVIFVVVGFRSELPEVSPRNRMFSALKAAGGLASDIHPRVAAKADEVIVTKHRVSAFAGTDLDIILRSNDIDTLVMCGLITSGVGT